MAGMCEYVAVELFDSWPLGLEPGETAREDLVALLVDQTGSCRISLVDGTKRPAGLIFLSEEPGQKAQDLGDIGSMLLVILGDLLAAVVLDHAGTDEYP